MTGDSTISVAQLEGSAPPAAASRLAQLPRVLVGAVLMATGLGKVLDIAGFVHVLAAYDLLPRSLTVALAYSLPFIELATGICLLARLQLRMAARIAIGLQLLLLTSVVITLWRGIAVANCGYFGVFLARRLSVGTAVEVVVMLALSCLALRAAPRR